MNFEGHTAMLVRVDGTENIVHIPQIILRQGKSSFFGESGVQIGRVSSNNIIILRDSISKKHAKIREEVENNEVNFYLYDLESTNGTYVNGSRIEGRHPLRNGDIIGFGIGFPELLRFIIESDNDVATTLLEDQGNSSVGLEDRLKYYPEREVFVLDGRVLYLTPHERSLLRYLYKHKGNLCRYDACAIAVWEETDTQYEETSLKVLKWQLSKKLGQKRNDPEETQFIITRRTEGYILVISPRQKIHNA